MGVGSLTQLATTDNLGFEEQLKTVARGLRGAIVGSLASVGADGVDGAGDRALSGRRFHHWNGL